MFAMAGLSHRRADDQMSSMLLAVPFPPPNNRPAYADDKVWRMVTAVEMGYYNLCTGLRGHKTNSVGVNRLTLLYLGIQIEHRPNSLRSNEIKQTGERNSLRSNEFRTTPLNPSFTTSQAGSRYHVGLESYAGNQTPMPAMGEDRWGDAERNAWRWREVGATVCVWPMDLGVGGDMGISIAGSMIGDGWGTGQEIEGGVTGGDAGASVGAERGGRVAEGYP